MDWSSIIVALIAALVPTGGLTAIVTLKDKKTAAFLDNTEKLINQWQEIADGRKVRMDELKADLDRKEDVIQEQWKEISDLRNELDHARTDKAVEMGLPFDQMGIYNTFVHFSHKLGGRSGGRYSTIKIMRGRGYKDAVHSRYPGYACRMLAEEFPGEHSDHGQGANYRRGGPARHPLCSPFTGRAGACCGPEGRLVIPGNHCRMVQGVGGGWKAASRTR